MKKFIIGVVFGALIASAFPAYGAVTSLVGQTVDGQKEVKLNGKPVGTAIIVDSTSYLPVRDTAEAIGAQVEPSSGVINMTIPLTNDAVESELYTLRSKKSFIEKKIVELQRIIKYQEEEAIPKTVEEEKIIDSQAVRTDAEKANAHKRVDDLNKSLANNKQKLADYQTQLDAINARIAELEAQ
jgi:hypothetical protein